MEYIDPLGIVSLDLFRIRQKWQMMLIDFNQS